MPRLPDVPLNGWIQDQQEIFQQKISGLDDATQFDDAASATIAGIPTADDTDQQAELDRRNREWEAQDQERRRAEQRRLQEQQAQAAEQQQQEAERQREEQLSVQARNQASSWGIPSPSDMQGFFSGLLNPQPAVTSPTPQPVTYGASGDDTSGMPQPVTPPAASPYTPISDYGTPVAPQPDQIPQGLPDLQQFSQNVDAISSPMIGPLDPTTSNNLQDWSNRLDTKTNDILEEHLAPVRQATDEVAAKNAEVFGRGDILGQILYNGNIPVGAGISPGVKNLEEGQKAVRMATAVVQSVPEIATSTLDAMLEAIGYSKRNGYVVDSPLGPVGIADVAVALAPGKLQAIPMAGTAFPHVPGMNVTDIQAARKLMGGVGVSGPILGEATGYGGRNFAGNVEWALGHDVGAAKDYITGALGDAARMAGPVVEPLGQAAINAGGAIDRAGGRGWDELANVLSSGARLAKQYPEAAAGLATAAVTKALSPDEDSTQGAAGLGTAVAGGVALTRPRIIAGELEKAPVFFSALRNELEAKVGRRGADPSQILNLIGYKLDEQGNVVRTRQTPVKEEELKWTGLADWLQNPVDADGNAITGKVSKQDLLDFVDSHQVQVQETVLGKPENVPEPTWTQLDDDMWHVRVADPTSSDHPPLKFTVQRIPTFSPGQEGDWARNFGNQLGVDTSPGYSFHIRGEDHFSRTVHSPEDVVTTIQDSVRTPTEYGTHTTKGGSNYRELLLTVPAPGYEAAGHSLTELHTDMLQRLDQAGLPHNATPYQIEEALGPEEARRIQDIRLGIIPDDLVPQNTPRAFIEGHFDEPNVLAHVRFDERTDAEGRRILHIDEIQSDWHQEGRRSGYETPESLAEQKAIQARIAEVEARLNESNRAYQEAYNRPGEPDWPAMEQARAVGEEASNEWGRLQEGVKSSAVPAGPYEKTWDTLAMKRMLRWAADNGFDRVTWEPGETHSNRWTTPRVDWRASPDGKSFDILTSGSVEPGAIPTEQDWEFNANPTVTSLEDLKRVLGDTYGMYGNHTGPGERELAENRDLATRVWKQMQAQPEGSFEPRTAGMAGFYDAALPKTVDDITKKFGARVQKVDLPEAPSRSSESRRYPWQIWDSQTNEPIEFFRTEQEAQTALDKYFKEDPRYSLRDVSAPTIRKVWGVDVTPEMKKSATEQGFSQFAALSPGLAEAAGSAGLGAGAGAASDNQDDNQPSKAVTGALLGMGAVKLARNIPKAWIEKLGSSPHIPEGAIPEQIAAIRAAYDATIQALNDSLNSRSVRQRMRLRTVANKAYEAYQKAVNGEYDASARTPVGTGPYPEGLPAQRASERVSTGVEPAPSVGDVRSPGGVLDSESGITPGRESLDAGAADTARTPVPDGSLPVDSAVPEGASGPTADDVNFEQDLLPDTLNPREPVSRDQLSNFIDTLRASFSGNDRVTNLIDRMVANLTRDVADPRMRHLEQILETVAQHPSNPQRVLGRREAPAVEAKAWAENWFRDNGFLAPKTTVEEAVPAIPALGSTDAAGLRLTPEQQAEFERLTALHNEPPLPGEEPNPFPKTPEEIAQDARDNVAMQGRSGDHLMEDPTATEDPASVPVVSRTDRFAASRQREIDNWAAKADVSSLDRMRPGGMITSSQIYGADSEPWDRLIYGKRAAIQAADKAGYILEPATYEDGVEGLRYVGKKTAGDTTQYAGGFSPLGSALGATGGATAGAVQGQDDTNDQYEVPIEKMIPGAIAGTVFGRRATRQIVRDAALEADPKLRMFATPTVTQNTVGLIDKAHNFWRNKLVPAMSDDIAALQGFQNDLAKIYYKATGSPLPAELMSAEMKRFDSSRSYEMAVNQQLKPALQAIDNLNLPLLMSNGKPMDGMAQTDAYLGHMMDMDVARNTGNGMRDFPGQGGSTYGDSLRYTKALEDRIEQLKGPQGLADFKAATQQIWDFGDHILQTLRDGGLIDNATYTDLRTKYPHYMPTKLVKYLRDGDFVGGGSGRSLSVNSNTLQELTKRGSEDEASSYIASLLGAGRQAYSAAAKNQVFTALVGMWHEAEQLQQQGLIPADRVGRRLESYAQGMVPVANTYTPGENEVSVTGFLNGLKQKFAVSKELGDLTHYSSPAIIPLLSGMMSIFRAGATSRNPVFLTANMILDLATFANRELARAGGPTPANIKKVFGAWGSAATEFLPWGMGAGALAGGYTGSSQINPEDTALTSAGKVGAGMLVGGGLGAGIQSQLPERYGGKVLRDIAQHEYRGDMSRFLEQGGGTSGGYYDTSLKRVDPLNPGEWVGPKGLRVDFNDVMRKFAPDWNKAPLEHEINTLRRQSPLEVHSPADAVRILKDLALLKPVEAIGERIELVPRVAAMRLAEGRAAPEIKALQDELAQQGQALQNLAPGAQLAGRHPQDVAADLADRQWRSNVEGTQAGRTTTLDFNKGGTWARFINQIIPFFNVGVQAMADTPRMIHESGWKNTAATMTGAVVLPTIAAEVWNNADPQRAKDYADVPSYIKDQGIVIMLPRDQFPPSVDQQGNEHPQFFHWRERHLAPLTIATREFLQRSIYSGSPSDANRRDALEAVLGGVDQVSPIGGIGKALQGKPEELLTNMSPPLVSAGTQAAFNEDTFRGTRINSEFADKRASPLSQGLAHFTGDRIRPSTLEFLSRDLGTGYAGMLHGASDILTGKKPESSSDVPFVGGLTGRFKKGSIGEGAIQAEEHAVSPAFTAFLKREGVNIAPQPASPYIQDVPLTRIEMAQYQRGQTEALNKAQIELEGSEIWRKGPPADKERYAQHIMDLYREQARYDFINNIIGSAEWSRRRTKAMQEANTPVGAAR